MYFCRKRNSNRIGSAEITDPAANQSHCFSFPPTQRFMPTASVQFCWLVRIVLDRMKSLNAEMKDRSPTTARIGITSGMMIPQ